MNEKPVAHVAGPGAVAARIAWGLAAFPVLLMALDLAWMGLAQQDGGLLLLPGAIIAGCLLPFAVWGFWLGRRGSEPQPSLFLQVLVKLGVLVPVLFCLFCAGVVFALVSLGVGILTEMAAAPLVADSSGFGAGYVGIAVGVLAGAVAAAWLLRIMIRRFVLIKSQDSTSVS